MSRLPLRGMGFGEWKDGSVGKVFAAKREDLSLIPSIYVKNKPNKSAWWLASNPTPGKQR